MIAVRNAWERIRDTLVFVALFCIVAPLLSLACWLGLLPTDDEYPETLGPPMEGDDVW